MLRRLVNALVSMPAVCDLVQNLAGQARIAEQLRRSLAALPSGRTLDVGSSGGLMSDRLGVAPVFVDIDLRPPGRPKPAVPSRGLPLVAAPAVEST